MANYITKVIVDGTDASIKDTETSSNLSKHVSDKNNPHGVTAAQTGAVAKTGDKMTGNLMAPSFQTGADSRNYFQCKKFRGEGDASNYSHAIDFGYYEHNQVDFHEYGGVWNFYKNVRGHPDTGELVGAIKAYQGWSGKVNGHMIYADVPADAKFTDTTYSAITNAQIDSITSS